VDSSNDSSLSLAEVQRRLQAFEDARDKRPWRYYTAVPKVRGGFHSSKAKYRLLTGPNGGGKSWAGGYEAISYATGYNEIRDEHFPFPNRGWVVARDSLNQGPLLQRIIMEMAPKGTRFIEKKQKFILPHPWKSEIYMKTTESGVGAFTAERILWAWFDEERESDEGLEIFKQTMRRTQPGWPLRIYMTVTPIEGYTWSYDYLYDERSKKRFPGVETFNFTIFDAAKKNGGFLSDEEVQEAVSKCRDSRDYQTTCLGQYALTQGDPAFDPDQLMDALKRVQPYRRGRLGMGSYAASWQDSDEGEFVMILPPKSGEEYILGADASMGVGKDNSVATVWMRSAPVEVAYWKGNRLEPSRFAKLVIAPMATHYNNAMAAVESTGEAGGALLAHLPKCYGHIYMQQDFMGPGKGFRRRYGFRTDAHSRGLLFDSIKDLLPRDNFVASEEFLREAMHMVVDDRNKIDHIKGRKSDHVIAAGIALAVNRLNPTPSYKPWHTYREDYSEVAGSNWG
jgi:hypothetical protein